MEPNEKSLRIRYSEMETEELLDLFREGTLTSLASSVLDDVLTDRGITEEDKADIVEKSKQDAMESAKDYGFLWWVIWASLGLSVGNVFIIIQLQDDIVAAITGITVNTFIMIMILRYNKYAFLIATVLSLNPILWLINGVYLKNRWNHPKVNSKKEELATTTET